jgi:hypothetical protein
LRFPRCGIGARKGASVSIRMRSSGVSRTDLAQRSAVLNVTMPEKESAKPSARHASASPACR